MTAVHRTVFFVSFRFKVILHITFAQSMAEDLPDAHDLVCELPTPKGMSFGDTNTSSFFLLPSATAF